MYEIGEIVIRIGTDFADIRIGIRAKILNIDNNQKYVYVEILEGSGKNYKTWWNTKFVIPAETKIKWEV